MQVMTQKPQQEFFYLGNKLLKCFDVKVVKMNYTSCAKEKQTNKQTNKQQERILVKTVISINGVIIP